MAQNFIACDREQPFLLPPDVRDWLPENHLAWFVIDTVGVMDLAAFYVAYRQDGHGRAAYEPAVMAALLLYCWARGTRSSRAIERACVEDVACRVIAAQQRPDHATIARFAATTSRQPPSIKQQRISLPRRNSGHFASLSASRCHLPASPTRTTWSTPERVSASSCRSPAEGFSARHRRRRLLLAPVSGTRTSRVGGAISASSARPARPRAASPNRSQSSRAVPLRAHAGRLGPARNRLSGPCRTATLRWSWGRRLSPAAADRDRYVARSG